MSWQQGTRYKLYCWSAALALVVLVLATTSPGVNAQNPADNQPAAAPAAAAANDDVEPANEEPIEQADSLGSLIFRVPTNAAELFSAVFYLTLFIFSLVAMTVILERMVNLQRGAVMPPLFVQRLKDLIRGRQDTPENYRLLCESSNSTISRVLHAGLLRAGRPLPEVEKGMEDAVMREVSALRARNRPLSVVGSTAPLVGLLGTVVGMIFAFRGASQAGLGRAEVLAEGIYLALMTTAAGLAIAIPCLLLVARFNGVVERFMYEIDEALLETLPSFTRLETTSPSPRAADEADAARQPEPAVAGVSE